MKKFLIPLALGFTLGTGAAHADLLSLDGDGDGMISLNEYGTYEDRTFAGYDANSDGMIDADEYRAGNFRRYDRDRDGMFNEEERARYEEDEGLFD